MDRKTTRVSGRSLRISRVASKLLMPAMPISISTTSGRTCLAMVTASEALPASPDDFHIRFGRQQGSNSLPEESVIVSQEYANFRHSMPSHSVSPRRVARQIQRHRDTFPGLTAYRQRSAEKRCTLAHARQSERHRLAPPASRAKPAPLSETLNLIFLSADRRKRFTRVAWECLAIFCRHSCATR